MAKSTTARVNLANATLAAARLRQWHIDNRDAIAAYFEVITAELSAIAAHAAANPARYRAECLTFASMSPQMPFARNVAAVRFLINHVGTDFTATDTATATATLFPRTNRRVVKGEEVFSCPHGGVGRDSTVKMFTSGFVAEDAPLSRDYLYDTVAGFGLKASAMATALYDATAAIVTVDVHMLKPICWLADIAESGSVDDDAYRLIESAYLSVWAELFPDVPTFVCQWAVWNHVGFGHHMSHLPIFGL